MVVYVHWLRAVLANFHVVFSAERRTAVVALDRAHLDVHLFAEALEQLADGIGGLRRIGGDGGGRDTSSLLSASANACTVLFSRSSASEQPAQQQDGRREHRNQRT